MKLEKEKNKKSLLKSKPKKNDKKKRSISNKAKEKSIIDVMNGKTCFAFDFGDFATKIVMAKFSSKGKIEIKDVFVVENDDRSVKIEESNIKEWHNKLSKVINQNSLSTFGQYAVCTMSSRYYISRDLEVPYADEKDMLGLVSYEMCQSLSLDKDSYYFQYKVKSIEEKNGGKVCKVWVAALQKTICDAYYELLNSLHLNPLVMDINVDGLERLFVSEKTLSQIANNNVIATIDFGMHGTEINVFENGKYIQGSNNNIGDGKFVSAAKNVLGVQISDVHNGNKIIVDPRIIFGITAHKEVANSKIFISILEEWLTEIAKSIKRYNISFPTAKISKIVMYGGSPQLVWLKQYLEKFIGIEVILVNSFECENIVISKDAKEINYSQFLNVLSLLLIK